LAVFSEIYYKDWKAYVDGKPASFGKANYVLRTMLIPAGKHQIEFKFEPQSVSIGNTLSTIFGWLISLLLFAALLMSARNLSKKNTKTTPNLS
jgi:uncharacterized membrane protein YfhO